MKKNMGTADRAIRTFAAVVILLLLLGGQLEGTLAWILGIVAMVFLLTSAVSFCPAYLPFKISTRKQVTAK